MYKHILIVSLFALQALSASASVIFESRITPYTINISQSGKHYYHLMYELNSDNLLGLESLTKEQFRIGGGQFEVIIKKALFPIDAPNCKTDIILRMPWSENKQAIEKKYKIYNNIKLLKKYNRSVNIAIELNPYVEKSLDRIKLTQCNVFFRHANNEYIPHINGLKDKT